jgi:hypothetical protein
MNTTKTLVITSPEIVNLREKKENLYSEMMEVLDSPDRLNRLNEDYFRKKDEHARLVMTLKKLNA